MKQSRQGQFLAQMANQLHKEALYAHHPFEVAWCSQEQMCLTIMKSLKFLNILNAIFCSF